MKKIIQFFVLSLVFATQINAQAILPASWNFSNPSIANPPAGFTLNILLGTDTRTTYSPGVGDNIAARLDFTGEFIQVNVNDKPGNVSYYLRGTAISPNPPFTGSFKIQESVNGQIWTDVRTLTSMTSGFTRYQDALQAATRFVRFFYNEKQANSNVGLDSILITAAPAPVTPVLVLKHLGKTLVNGANFVSGNASNTPLVIQNGGTSQVLLVDSVRFIGLNASDFSVTNLPDSVPFGQAKGFNISFNPGANGSRFATMLLYTNDPDKRSFSLSLYGIGGSLATEPSGNAQAINFASVKSYGYATQLNASNKLAEKYLILRKLGSAITETPTDGQSYKRGDYIGSAQVEIVADSSIVFNPNYILANQTYHYAVYSFNGPAGYENYLTSTSLKNSVSTSGKTPGNYYQGINPANANFVTSLTARINPHDTVFYSSYIPRLVNPWIARDTSNSKKVVTCVYTGHQFLYDEPFLWAAGNNGAVLTREHTWPQSWMPSNQGNPDWPNAPGTTSELPEYNDLHNLFPAHQTNANARRSNNPFHEVVTPTYTSPTGFGMLGKDSFNITSYEPRPEQKGDIARALYYMAVCYNGSRGNSWTIPNQQSLTILKQWHQMDPPDAFEIARNEYIAVEQGNRNPFIDFPEWADRINFRTMAYIPGDSIPPLPKSIVITEPTVSSSWKKGEIVNIAYTYQNIDSVTVLFSEDSMATWMNLGLSNLPTTTNPIKFTIANFFTKPYGVLIVKESAGKTADTSVYFMLEMANGLNSRFEPTNLIVYPNPASAKVTIETSGTAKVQRISVIDLQGRLLASESANSINVEALQNGIYLLQIETNFGVLYKKFEKQH
jgi:endonuclease I